MSLSAAYSAPEALNRLENVRKGTSGTRDINRLSTITTMLISRDQILRLGVQKVLTARDHIRLVGPPAGTAEIGEHVAHEQPQVIIIDSQVEREPSGLIQQIKALVPNGKIVLLMGLDEAGRNWRTLPSGVDGVILKMQPPAALIASIETLCELTPNGSLQEGPQVSASLPSPSSQWPGSLTDREREIVTLIGHGLSNKDIAERLCISVITVRHHLTSIFDKFGVATRQKLLIRAHQYGLVELSVPA
jgi:DNA-binding NarL/FixJ family response regulator